MRKIVVPKPKNDSLTAQLNSIIQTFSGISVGEQVDFDLTNIDWCCPLLVLPISAYINVTQSKFSAPLKSDTNSYLATIDFPKGIDSVSELEASMRADKNYLPISILKRENRLERARLETLFSQLLYKQLSAADGSQNAIYYPIAELVGNIFEHSKKDEGYIFAQFYPQKKYIDICIVDCGRGLAKCYQEEKGLILTDDRAIEEVLRGNSTKSNIERGYGVRTSKRIVCEGLGGGFILVSGKAVLVSVKDKQQLAVLPNFDWQGLIVAYRIPVPTAPIDITKYLE